MRGHVLSSVLLPVVAFVGLTVAVLRPLVAGADLARGQSTYRELCAKCHGAKGKGDGREAATLATKPQDLTDCERMKKFGDDELFRAIKEGGEAVKLSDDMPSYSDSLEDDEIQDLVTFVRSLCTR